MYGPVCARRQIRDIGSAGQSAGLIAEVAARRDMIRSAKFAPRFIAQNRLHLAWRPNVKLTFFAFAVGVKGGVETAVLGFGHIAPDKIAGFNGDKAVDSPPR